MVLELVHIFMGVADNLLRFVRMLDVMSQFLRQVGKVFTHFYVVVAGTESPFHEPCLASGARHDGQRVGRHDPFQVRGHVVSFECHDEFVIQVFADGSFGGHPFFRASFVASHHAAVEHRMPEIHFQEFCPHPALADFSPEDGHVFFLTEGDGVVHEHEVAQLVQFEDDGVAVVPLQQPAFHNGGFFRCEIDIAGAEIPTEILGKPTGHVVLVKVVGGVEHVPLVVA